MLFYLFHNSSGDYQRNCDLNFLRILVFRKIVKGIRRLASHMPSMTFKIMDQRIVCKTTRSRLGFTGSGAC